MKREAIQEIQLWEPTFKQFFIGIYGSSPQEALCRTAMVVAAAIAVERLP